MKQNILYIAAIFAALVSCTKFEKVAEEKTYDPKDLEFVFNIDEPSSFVGATKSVKTGWTEGDKIYIAFDINSESSSVPQNLGEFLILQYTGGAWTVLQTTSKTLNATGRFDALYMDVEPNITFSYSAQMNTSASKGQFMYLIAKGGNYVITGNKVTPSASLVLGLRENRARQFCVTGLSDDEWKISFEIEGHSYHFGADIPEFGRSNGISYTGFTWNDRSDLMKMAQRTDGHYFWGTLDCTPYEGNVNLTVWLQNATYGKFHKTFTKTIQYKSAITFAGPDNYTSPTNGWVKE